MRRGMKMRSRGNKKAEGWRIVRVGTIGNRQYVECRDLGFVPIPNARRRSEVSKKEGK